MNDRLKIEGNMAVSPRARRTEALRIRNSGRTTIAAPSSSDFKAAVEKVNVYAASSPICRSAAQFPARSGPPSAK